MSDTRMLRNSVTELNDIELTVVRANLNDYHSTSQKTTAAARDMLTNVPTTKSSSLLKIRMTLIQISKGAKYDPTLVPDRPSKNEAAAK